MTKEQTLPPLVSDDETARLTAIENDNHRGPHYRDGYIRGLRVCRDIYEQDRQRTREVVQALVDALDEISKYSDCGMSRSIAKETLAKSQLQIEPTQ